MLINLILIKEMIVVEIFKFVFGEEEKKYVCIEKYVGVRYNFVFIINLDKIDLWWFFNVDDNGVWSVVILRKYFCVEIEDVKVIDVRLVYMENYDYFLKC